MRSMKEVQIIGTQRSGSNLLRLMLNQLAGVFAPHPPHIMRTFYPLLKNYGDLGVDNHFMTLVDDVCRLVELNPVPWEPLRTDRNLIFEKCKNRSLTEIFRNIHQVNAQAKGANCWFNKSMQNVKYLDCFSKLGFNPKLIYLYRDGRDVALSFKNAIVGPKHIYNLAKKWTNEQKMSLSYVRQFGEEHAIMLSYESLLLQPEMELNRLCDFLGLEYNRDVVEFYDSSESIRTADSGRMWSNLKKPIIRGNFGKYKKGLTAWEIEVFEQIAGETLVKLGYTLSANFEEKKYEFTKENIEIFASQDAELMKEAIEHADPEDLFKRKRQEQFIESVKKRW